MDVIACMLGSILLIALSALDLCHFFTRYLALSRLFWSSQGLKSLAVSVLVVVVACSVCTSRCCLFLWPAVSLRFQLCAAVRDGVPHLLFRVQPSRCQQPTHTRLLRTALEPSSCPLHLEPVLLLLVAVGVGARRPWDLWLARPTTQHMFQHLSFRRQTVDIVCGATAI